ncbi:MAG: SDR family NAD(P)-dependent oxidoreductase, partial [Bacteroidia bacterium]|nr:SDR family NAD(P)-dependent oxidoreductase [Bacteroidia bacterium]
MNRKRISLVTGAAKGIGKAITIRMVSEDHFVVAVDVDDAAGSSLMTELGKENLCYYHTD